MTTEKKTITKLDKATAIKQELMQENVHYGQIQGATSDFLWLSGASLLADKFEIDALLEDLREETVDGQSRITVILNMVHADSGDRICTGVGTWDSGEMLGNRQGARQRGIAMAYKRAYVLGVRYATFSHGLFSQDDDLVKKSVPFKGNSVAAKQQQQTSGEQNTTIDTVSEQNTQGDTDSNVATTISDGIPPEMSLNEHNEPVFERFGSFVIGRTIGEVLADATIDKKSGEPKGTGYLTWIRDKTDASESLKILINEGLVEYANN